MLVMRTTENRAGVCMDLTVAGFALYEMALGNGAGLISTTNGQERDRVWLFGGMDMSLSASSGESTGSWRIFSRPLAFFSSEGMRSSQVSISARVRSAQASTVLSRLIKKSTTRALM